MAYGNFRGSGSRGGRGFGGGGFRRSFGPREMTKIKCSECGKEDEVPFKPREGTPVYCKDCYFKKKGIEPRAQTREKPKKETSEEEAEAEDTEASDEAEEFGEEKAESSGSEEEI